MPYIELICGVKSACIFRKNGDLGVITDKNHFIGRGKAKMILAEHHLLHSVFRLNSVENRAYRLCKHYYKCDI